MNRYLIEKSLAIFWLSLVGYDTFFGMQESLGIFALFALIAGLITVLACAKWGIESKNTNLMQLATISASAWFVFVLFGWAIDLMDTMLPVSGSMQQTILTLLAQSFIASIIAAILIGIPLAIVFAEKLKRAVFIICAPTLGVLLSDISYTKYEITKLVTILDAILLLLVAWAIGLLAIQAMRKIGLSHFSVATQTQ
jgi:hypothetical protein